MTSLVRYRFWLRHYEDVKRWHVFVPGRLRLGAWLWFVRRSGNLS
jgi:hypothetical protein